MIGNTKCHLGICLNALRDKESAQEIVGMTSFIHCFREWAANASGINRFFLCTHDRCITFDIMSWEKGEDQG